MEPRDQIIPVMAVEVDRHFKLTDTHRRSSPQRFACGEQDDGVVEMVDLTMEIVFAVEHFVCLESDEFVDRQEVGFWNSIEGRERHFRIFLEREPVDRVANLAWEFEKERFGDSVVYARVWSLDFDAEHQVVVGRGVEEDVGRMRGICLAR